ncbi:MAG: YhdP family protein [Gammaproteobacteria bacterium]
MRRILERCLSLLWTAIAVLLIAGAAFVTLLRILLPQIGEQRVAMEGWLSELIGRPVQVGAIDAGWRGWAPRIGVTRLVILDEHADGELMHFDRADIDIAPLESLRARSLKPLKLSAAGVAISLVRDVDGRLHVAGMPPAHAPLMRWLFEQGNFALRDADVTINDQRAQQSYALSGLSVSVLGRGARKTITAYLDLPPNLGRHAALELRTRGNPLDPHWEGTIDARLDGLSSGWLLRQGGWRGALPNDVPVNLVAWSQWQDGQLRHSDFELTAERGREDAKPLLAARGQWLRQDDGWRLALADVALPDVPGDRGDGRLTLRLRQRGDGPRELGLRAAGLPFESLAHLVAVGAPDSALAASLGGYAPRGRLARLDAWWRPVDGEASPYFVAARVRRLALREAARDRAVEDLSFDLAANRGGVVLSFDDEAFSFTDPTRYPAPLAIEGLGGALTWRPAAGEAPPLVELRALSATVAGNQVEVAGRVELPPDTAPVYDLEMRLASPAATRLAELLPQGALPGHGDAWARRLFEDGEVSAGRIGFHGVAADFPFRQGEGEFSADFDVRAATLRYALHWPLASGVDATVSARGPAVEVRFARGAISGARIDGAVVTLPDVATRERQLHIHGTARGPAASALAVVHDSPLALGRARRLQELEIDGPIALDLDIDIGLYPNGPHLVDGVAHFDGNRISAPAHHVTLDDVTGTVEFDQGAWQGKHLAARYGDGLVQLAVQGGGDAEAAASFSLEGAASAADLVEDLHRYTPTLHGWLASNARLDAFSGRARWRATLALPSATAVADGAHQRLVVESDLQGLGIDLPAPLAKPQDSVRPLKIAMTLEDGRPTRTEVTLDDAVAVALESGPDESGRARLSRVEAVLGERAPRFDGLPGLSLRGRTPLLPLGDWTRFVSQATATATRDGVAAAPQLPVSFDVETDELRLLGRRFGHQRLAGTYDARGWRVTISGDDVAGGLTMPLDPATGALRLDLERLHLAPTPDAAASARTSDIDPRSLPAFELRCADFRYGDSDLGRAEIVTSRHAVGLALDKLGFAGDGFTIAATGEWLFDGGQHRSSFDIDVKAEALGQLLSRFGYQVANIEHGKTRIDINAHWDGTPADFALAGIDGSFELKVKDGRFLDIDPGTGRLFGLLSLQALPRRLTLDFEDLFDKGLVFDHISGVFQLQDGNAYTNSLTIEGPSARFDISGRTGLATKDYDQHIVVTPALSASLPLAGALFGPIGAGAGAAYYIGSKMFKSIPEQMNRFLTRKYTITGSWDNPVVKRI